MKKLIYDELSQIDEIDKKIKLFFQNITCLMASTLSFPFKEASILTVDEEGD